MDNFTALIDKIIAFARADKDIRAVILEIGRQRMNSPANQPQIR